MATNTAALKTFAQATRAKLVQLITTKLQYVLNADTAELRGYEKEIDRLRAEIAKKTKVIVIEEVAYTWFNRVMALRYMDANEYLTPMIVTPAAGQHRPEILQDAMGGTVDEDLCLTREDILLPEAKLYKKLLVAVCNKMNQPMPFLFEHIMDYTELLLPDDLLSEQSFVADIRKGMTNEDCQNVEIMGWLYQFYITDRKADAEKKKGKKGGLKSDEQAAATQLFTPHWIVRYMVENSLGRIWMAMHPDSHLIDSMPYYIKPEEGQADPLPEGLKSVLDIRFLDPCMGSAHILVYAFDLFTIMYEEEGFLHKDIPTLILQNNIFGMDIDRRCYQLACFALTMKARAYYSRYLRNTVQPNVIALQNISKEIIDVSGVWSSKSLIWQFQNIDTIGSLLKVTPEECNAIKVQSGLWGEQQKFLKIQAEYLTRKYHCVVTNPPYLGKGMGDELKGYVESQYPNTKGDIMASFMERGLELCIDNGKLAMINQDSWMFTSSYETYRCDLLSSDIQIETLIHLGPHAFAEIGGEKVKTVTFVIGKYASNNIGMFINVYNYKSHNQKEQYTLEAISNRDCGWFYKVNQNAFTHITGNPISFWGSEKIYSVYSQNEPVSSYAKTGQGLATGDNDSFLRSWFEVNINSIGFHIKNTNESIISQKKWFPYNKGGTARKWYGNQVLVVNWSNDGYEIKHCYDEKGKLKSRPQNVELYFKPSISWGLISGPLFRYFPQGFIYDVQGMSCFYNSQERLYSDIAWMNTKVFNVASKIISPAGHIQLGEMNNMPSCMYSDFSKKIGEENISISKQDWDAHETSWDFKENDFLRVYREELELGDTPQKHSLSVMVEYYKTEWEGLFNDLHQNEEELNRRFIEIYGLQDELTPDVPLNEVTILQKGEISIENNNIVWHEAVIIKQLLSYLVGCFMGRYSVDKLGLIIASQHQDLKTLGLHVDGINNGTEGTLGIDDDGIIPIVQDPDFFADDMTQRIEMAIKKIFGEEKFNDNIKYVTETLGCSIRDYLYKDFFADHCAMYSVKGAKRPIYWLFSSRMGDNHKKGYFKALVYMHRMEADTLSKLHADYVRPYIIKTEQQLREAEEESTRDGLSQAQRNKALNLSEELRDKVREVRIFEQQLVEMASHRVIIDLDDGVKANYPKFYPLVEPIKGLENNDD